MKQPWTHLIHHMSTHDGVIERSQHFLVEGCSGVRQAQTKQLLAKGRTRHTHPIVAKASLMELLDV